MWKHNTCKTYTHTRKEESTLQRPPYKDLPNANCVKKVVKGGGGGGGGGGGF
jgi:hypothetical protein